MRNFGARHVIVDHGGSEDQNDLWDYGAWAIVQGVKSRNARFTRRRSQSLYVGELPSGFTIVYHRCWTCAERVRIPTFQDAV